MSKGLPELIALVGEIKTLTAEKPKDALDWATKVSGLLDWLETNGWTVKDLSDIVKMGATLWTLIKPMLEKPADPQ